MANKKQVEKVKDVNELENALKEAREALPLIRMEQAQSKLKNTRSIFLKRKEIARILTEMRGKELLSE
ncbi:MAG: 50S ribosomal protein L29 [Patescibacteria group bacterium]|nr:50S ribosomal protein L29 [Patescibacteria group bacterium]